MIEHPFVRIMCDNDECLSSITEKLDRAGDLVDLWHTRGVLRALEDKGWYVVNGKHYCSRDCFYSGPHARNSEIQCIACRAMVNIDAWSESGHCPHCGAIEPNVVRSMSPSEVRKVLLCSRCQLKVSRAFIITEHTHIPVSDISPKLPAFCTKMCRNRYYANYPSSSMFCWTCRLVFSGKKLTEDGTCPRCDSADLRPS